LLKEVFKFADSVLLVGSPFDFGEDMTLMYEWLAETGYSVNIQSFREEHPEIAWDSFS